MDDLPDTQTPREAEELEFAHISPEVPWGKLFSTVMYLPHYDIKTEQITLGRAESCNISLGTHNFDPNQLPTLSKVHFTLSRNEEFRFSYIIDQSKNGTFVNGHCVGKGNKYVLSDNDSIAVGVKNCQVYKFKATEALPEGENYLPEDMRKKYVLGKSLGKGACGEVRQIFERETCKVFAVKKITKGAYSSYYRLNHPQKIESEINILKQLNHPCVIKMLDVWETEQDVFIILEYMKGGTLVERIYSLQNNEANVKFLFTQILTAVQYLHYEGVTHRDLKPENILLMSEDRETLIKVTDFGLSKLIEDGSMITQCGTVSYIAPEVFKNDILESYDSRVDIWSLGVILYQMLGKDLPFQQPPGERRREMVIAAIKRGQFTFGRNFSGISKHAMDLVKRMLVVDPDKRIKISQILKHPWLAKDPQTKRKIDELISNNNDVDDTDTISNFSTFEESFEFTPPPAKRICIRQ